MLTLGGVESQIMVTSCCLEGKVSPLPSVTELALMEMTTSVSPLGVIGME